MAKSVFGAEEIWESITHELLDVRDVPEDRSAIRVTLDWTDLGRFAALVLAIPYRGRALPLAVEVIPKAFLDQMMTDLEITLVQRFLGWLSADLRSRIVILADREFAKVELMETIEEAGAFYVIRLRRDARIRLGTGWVQLQALGVLPGENRLYPSVRYTQEHGKELHVAIRRLSAGKANDPDDDTWYLATNWVEPAMAAPWYSLRFKIEEMFKDLKCMLDVAGHQMKEEEGLSRLVAVVGLYYTFVILHGQAQTTPERLRQITRGGNRNPELGIFRQAQAILCLWAAETEAPPLDFLMSIWTQRHRSGHRWSKRTGEAA